MATSYHDEARIQKRRKIVSKTSRIIVSALITATSVVILLFFLNLFDARVVSVESSSLISKEEIEAKTWEVLQQRPFGIPRKNNILVFSPNKIRTALLSSFPRISSVEVRRASLHEISIKVIDRTAVGLWCLSTRGRCYYFGVEGIAFTEIASSSGFLFIAVDDARDREIRLGDTVAPESWRRHILEAKKILQFGGIRANRFEISADSRDEFSVVTSDGWKIYYVNKDSVRTQTDNLIVFLREKITPQERANLAYIDLRIDDRIYYKLKE